MLTRSRSKALNQPVFIDEKWNDAYIQTKDEEIDAMLASNGSYNGWGEFDDETFSVSEEDDADDVWYSDSDESEEKEEDWLNQPDKSYLKWTFFEHYMTGGSLFQNLVWTLAAMGVTPLLLYISLPHCPDVMWPLQSPRLIGMVSKIVLNLLTFTVGGVMIYMTSCSVEPLTLSSVMYWRQLHVENPGECRERLLHEGKTLGIRIMEILASGLRSDTTFQRFNDDMWTFVASLDALMVRKFVALVALSLVTVTCFHRVWAKILVLLTVVGCVLFYVVTEVKMQHQSAVEIYSLDPTFAFANESIFVAIDGQNLEEGGSMAWVPYWGGAHQKPARACPKHYPQQLNNGGVLVTFDHVNEYIPCYLSAKETASAIIVDGEIEPSEAFQCFESIRLRVKDPKSVPGWSLHQHNQEEDPLFPIEKQDL